MSRTCMNTMPPPVRSIFAIVLASLVALPAVVSIFAILLGAVQTGYSVRYPPPSFGVYWLARVILDPQWLAELRDSFAIAFLAGVLTVVLGFGTAAALRWLRANARFAAFAVLLLPLLVPPLLLAAGLYRPMQILGLFDTVTGIAIVHTALALPVAVVPLVQAFDTFDLSFWRAAQNMGLTKWQATLRLALPASRNALFLAASLAFLISFNEVAISLYLSQVRVQPVVRGIWSSVRYELSPEVFAVAFWILVADALLGGAVWKMLRRGLLPR